MATLKPTLTLTNADSTGDALNITVTDTLTVSEPSVNIARAAILHTGVTTLLTTAQAAHTFMYLKNMDTTNIITISTDGGTAFMTLNPGEFAFFPLKGTVGIEAQANTATCILEYGYWTRT